ncbi:MAG: YjfB family protein [Ectothiorhodospiraceae bacterium]|nr:YjfB family protein [Ectothiorhodospiraceae bacterium]MCH8505712.1 YjfB family protein [Ectothiorhodospiraceae bacterium]
MSEVSMIASMATSLSQAQLARDVQTSVQRKALDIVQESAAQLIDGLPDIPEMVPDPAQRVGTVVDVSV